MSVNTPIKLKQKSQDSIVQLYRSCASNFMATWNIRQQLEEADRIYMRERDLTAENAKAVAANRMGDPTKFRNVEVPIAYTAVESAVTYQTSVFLTGVPLFGVSASPKYMDAALQMETIVDNQSVRGGWTRQLQLAFRDGFKYNIAACELDWVRKKIYTPETDLARSRDQGIPMETYWSGNELKRLDPYNLFWDVRYKPTDISERGEFVGYTDLYSRTELVRFLQSLTVRMNYKLACESGPSTIGLSYPSDYWIPQLNPMALIDQTTTGNINWMQWVGLEQKGASNINFRNSYFVTTFYCRIVPSEIGIDSESPHSPQIWKFYIVNGQVVVYAERQTNAHDRIPILFMQPNDDGLGYQTKSLLQNTAPFQAVGSALLNSSIQARRRALSDRGLYDPSKIDKKDINNDSASAKIPVRPSAYGQPLSNAYFPIPYRDEQSAQTMSDLQAIMAITDQTTGFNRAQQGQFVKGNKTMVEYQDVMANANARSQTTSILLEDQFFTPLKEIIKLNVLQYQGADTVFSREVGDEVVVDPVALRKANMIFKVSDGQTPASKQMNSESFGAACQAIATVPQLAGAYNIGPMFSYLFKMQRADVAQFEKPPALIQYEQAMNQWQQAVAVLAEQLSKQQMTPEDIQKSLPPQPTPEQFGLDPNNPQVGKPEPQGTILEQVANASQSS